jgi:hypothetical protein
MADAPDGLLFILFATGMQSLNSPNILRSQLPLPTTFVPMNAIHTGSGW